MFSLRKLIVAVAGFATSMSSVGIALFLALDGMTMSNLLRALGLVGFAGLAAVGYGLALWLARNHTRSDARIGGRRDLIAGILAIVLLFAASVATQGAPPALRFTICVVAGALSAALMYFPWFQRRPQPLDAQDVRVDA